MISEATGIMSYAQERTWQVNCDQIPKRCEAGSLTEIWRVLSSITIAKLRTPHKTLLKLSRISRFAQKLLTLCNVPSLEEVLSE